MHVDKGIRIKLKTIFCIFRIFNSVDIKIEPVTITSKYNINVQSMIGFDVSSVKNPNIRIQIELKLLLYIFQLPTRQRSFSQTSPQP